MPMRAVIASAPMPWYRSITRDQWRVLVAAKLGWMLDAMDFMIYAMAVGRLKTYNAGRLAGALAPYVIGVLAQQPHIGLGLAIASTSAFFLASAVIIFALPDRSGEPLES